MAEGWHGVAFHRPLTRTREYVEIIRKILAREEPLTYEGYHYQLPLSGPGTTGAGKPLKSVAHPNASQPIFLASISPGGLRLAGEIADGVLLSFVDPANTAASVDSHLAEGLAAPGARCTRDEFTVSTFVSVVLGDDLAAIHSAMKPALARQLGGMGSKNKNFYAEFARRMGYDHEVQQIQSLYLSGQKEKAAALVPVELIDRCNLLGPPGRVRERLQEWREAERRGALDMMLINSTQPEAMQLLAEELL